MSSTEKPSRPPTIASHAMGAAVTRVGDRVTMLEIFFDLVFVFALMRVIALMEDEPDAASLGRGLQVLVLLWWAWCAFIWLGNRVRLDRGIAVVALLVSMAALFVAGLVIPFSWTPHAGGWANPALVLALAFTVVRVCYVSTSLWAARRDRRLHTQVLIDVFPQTVSSSLLIVGAVLGGGLQSACWAGAFALDFGVGWLASRYNGWRVGNPAHFVERHGLVLIIALGESVLSAGAGLDRIGQDGDDLGLALIPAVLAFLVVVGLWWLYFRGPADAGQSALKDAAPGLRPALARDGYTLGHLPLVVGVVYVALGSRLTLADVAAAPAAPASTVAVVALTGGLTCYLLGLGLFTRTMLGRWGRPPLLAAVTMVLPGGAAAFGVPSLVTLAMVAALVVVAAAVATPRLQR